MTTPPSATRRTDASPPSSGDPPSSAHRAASRGPWWIGEGSEPCTFCLQGYVLELEMRCVACDRPGCLHCMVRVRRAEAVEVFCPECLEESPDATAHAPGAGSEEG